VSDRPEILDLVSATPSCNPILLAHEISGGEWIAYDHMVLMANRLDELAKTRYLATLPKDTPIDEVAPFAKECFQDPEKMKAALEKPNKVIICMPPRHGKSMFCSLYFPLYWLSLFPRTKVLLASYEADYAASWGRKVRDAISEHGSKMGRDLKIAGTSKAASRWELENFGGGMFCAGARGPITGKGADLAIIDDPIKNDEEANSQTFRDKLWDWYLSTFSTRLHKGAATVCIMTRWHEDDLVGRLLKAQDEGGDRWDVIRMPAIAEEDEKYGDYTRKEGEPLCPHLIPKDMLESAKGRMGEYWYATMYQQRPFPRGGGMYRKEMVEIVDSVPPHLVKVRAWDLAASMSGKRTAGILMAKDTEGIYYVLDSVIGKWLPGDRDKVIRSTATRDGKGVAVRVEQEGGSGGIAQIHSIVRSLPGYSVEGVKVSGDKISRADPVAAQVNIGNLKFLRGPWNTALFDEMESFPKGKYSDQIDAMSLAFDYVAVKNVFRTAIYKPSIKVRSWRDETDLLVPTRSVTHWRKEFPS